MRRGAARSLAGVSCLARGLSSGGRGWAQGASRGLGGDALQGEALTERLRGEEAGPAAGGTAAPPRAEATAAPACSAAIQKEPRARARRQRIRQAPGLRGGLGGSQLFSRTESLRKTTSAPSLPRPDRLSTGFKGWRL